MKRLCNFAASLICCIPAMSFAHSCPDSSTIAIANHIVTPPPGYILSVLTPIQEDMRSTFDGAELISKKIDKETVELTNVVCSYVLSDDKKGAFQLKQHFLNIVTTDKALKETGWIPRNNRKWFSCLPSNVNSCEY